MSVLTCSSLITEDYTAADLVAELETFKDHVSSTVNPSSLVTEARTLLSKGFQLAVKQGDKQMREDVLEGLEPWLGKVRLYISQLFVSVQGEDDRERPRRRGVSVEWYYDHSCPKCSEDPDSSICLIVRKSRVSHTLNETAKSLYPNQAVKRIKHTQIF